MYPSARLIDISFDQPSYFRAVHENKTLRTLLHLLKSINNLTFPLSQIPTKFGQAPQNLPFHGEKVPTVKRILFRFLPQIELFKKKKKSKRKQNVKGQSQFQAPVLKMSNWKSRLFGGRRKFKKKDLPTKRSRKGVCCGCGPNRVPSFVPFSKVEKVLRFASLQSPFSRRMRNCTFCERCKSTVLRVLFVELDGRKSSFAFWRRLVGWFLCVFGFVKSFFFWN